MRRSYAGGGVADALASTITNSQTSIPGAAFTNWPTGADGPFAVVIGRGLPNEEKILVSLRSGATLNPVTRGYDGTTAQAHAASETLELCITAIDADEANQHTNAVGGVHGLAGSDSVAGVDAAQTFKNKTMNFAPVVGGNVATNLPRTAMPEIDADLDAEVAARIAADAAEATARGDADTAETAARIAADALRYTKTETDALLLTAQPIGAIQMYAGSVEPAGWKFCNGQAVSSATYPALFSAIGTTFGGTGTPLFNLPDMTGRNPVGAGVGTALAATGGADDHTIAEANLPAHTHSINHNHASFTTSGVGDGEHTHDANFTQTDGAANNSPGPIRVGSTAGNYTATISGTGGTGDHNHDIDVPNFTGTSGSTGSGTALDTRDKFLGINFIIRVA